MNEELQQALAEMITNSVAAAGDALAFTKEQLPEVVQQLLVFYLAWNTILFGTAVVVFVLSCISLCKALKDIGGTNAEGYIFFAIIFGAAGLFLGCDAGHDALQIWLAPKVYLLEYAANLVR